jgi:hypothetical protein
MIRSLWLGLFSVALARSDRSAFGDREGRVSTIGEHKCTHGVEGMLDYFGEGHIYKAPPTTRGSSKDPETVVVGCELEPHSINCRWWAGTFMRAVFPSSKIEIVTMDDAVAGKGPELDIGEIHALVRFLSLTC